MTAATSLTIPQRAPTARPHGTYVKYVIDRCRCNECRQANRDYEHERSQRIEPAYVSADRARAHVLDLAAKGVGAKTIAKRAGLAQSTLGKLIYGDGGRGTPPTRRIRKATEDAILAVTPADAADGGRIPAGPTWEHIDTLLARGWTKSAIARELGQESGGLQLSRNLVQARHARTVRSLLDRPVPPRVSRHGIHPVPQPDLEAERIAALADEARRADLLERQRAHRGIDTPVDPYELPRLAPEADTTFMARAACRLPNVPTWIFFPDRDDHVTIAAAKKVCSTCPVAADCAAYARRTGQADGIWGGQLWGARRRTLEAS